MEKGKIEFDDPAFRAFKRDRIELLKRAAKELNQVQNEVRKLSKEWEAKRIELPIFDLPEGWGVEPIDMILPCPSCGMLHVDKPESDMCECGHASGYNQHTSEPSSEHFVMPVCPVAECPCVQFKIAWDNPPHKSHLCRTEDGGCGIIWRPADVPTNGVAEIKTKGEKDTWTVHVQSTGV